MRPRVLAPNLIDHFYLGGDRIARLRGIEQTSEHQPEEWLAATVARADHGEIGLSRTEGGELLRDLVAGDPAGWVGPDHAAAADPADVGVLVKLLDARQRLPVHVHPTRDFASSHLGCPYGKTEAWFVLETEPGAAVHLGWSEAVDAGELDRRRDAQDSEWMLARMNRIEVTPGMGILVPAGTVHAIDAGIFLAEVQEPTDLSIVLEWSITTSTREESHLGLGFETVMAAVSTEATTAAELEQLVVRTDLSRPDPVTLSLLPGAADPYFQLHRLCPGGASEAGFGVVLVLDGSGRLVSADPADAGAIDVDAGQVLAVPAGFGSWSVDGQATVLLAGPGRGWPTTLRDGGLR